MIAVFHSCEIESTGSLIVDTLHARGIQDARQYIVWSPEPGTSDPALTATRGQHTRAYSSVTAAILSRKFNEES